MLPPSHTFPPLVLLSLALIVAEPSLAAAPPPRCDASTDSLFTSSNSFLVATATCALWKKYGVISALEPVSHKSNLTTNTTKTSPPLMHMIPDLNFEQNCHSWSPDDLLFERSENDTDFIMSSDEKIFTWVRTILLRDCDGSVYATAKETILSHFLGARVYSEYLLTDPNANNSLIARSRKEDLFSATITFSGKTGQLLATATTTFTSRFLQMFCYKSKWTVQFEDQAVRALNNMAEEILLKKSVLTLIAIKDVRDSSRSSNGNVSRSGCTNFWIFLWIILPLIGLALLIRLSCWLLNRKKQKNSKDNYEVIAGQEDEISWKEQLPLAYAGEDGEVRGESEKEDGVSERWVRDGVGL